MAALTDRKKYKRLAELFVLAMKSDSFISASTNNRAIVCLEDHGLTERQAEKFLDEAFHNMERGMLRSDDQILKDVATVFRRQFHGHILTHVQSILESGTVTEKGEAFYQKCRRYLHVERS